MSTFRSYFQCNLVFLALFVEHQLGGAGLLLIQLFPWKKFEKGKFFLFAHFVLNGKHLGIFIFILLFIDELQLI
ncbi:hypothetical protein PEDI_38490 [Persicobacter diffluens]|uniref:Uncharacterized protein n=1 Tax=Persicobacter diffluens TaxID=981 RepID=A0AAN5ALZ1_9BACT|nr:hypothetical protein PEDI_38490 [Persicobacter diffluens]